jgi:redox-sensitive bicupin YhaK (pirin superfamily)
MTAGGGILRGELSTERAYRLDRPTHTVQPWVNLPAP